MGIKAKFEQNPELKAKLMRTKLFNLRYSSDDKEYAYPTYVLPHDTL